MLRLNAEHKEFVTNYYIFAIKGTLCNCGGLNFTPRFSDFYALQLQVLGRNHTDMAYFKINDV